MSSTLFHDDPEKEPEAVCWRRSLLHAVPVCTALLAIFLLAHLRDLESLCLRFAESPSRETLPPAGLWMVVTLAAAVGVLTAFPLQLKHRVSLAAIMGAVVCGLALLPPPIMAISFLVPLAVSVLFGRDLIRGRELRWDLLSGAFLVLILSWAAAYRYEHLIGVLPQKVDPDVEGYIAIARESSGWATKFREPLYIWVLQLLDLAGGSASPVFIRLAGFFLSLSSIALVFEFTRRVIGLPASVIAGFLYAAVPFMAHIAVRGLREDLVIATTFLFIGSCLHVWNRPPASLPYLLLGLAGAAATLVRLNSLSFVLVLMIITAACTFWKVRPAPRRAALVLLPLTVTLVLVLPYLLYLKKEYGDPFFVVNWHIRFYTNVELVGKHPDIPSAEEIARDGYAGPPITAREYLFKYHTVPQLISGTMTGAWRMLAGDFMRVAYGNPPTGLLLVLVYLTHVAGLLSMLLPRRRFTLFALVWFHVPMLYIASLRSFDPRLVTVAFVGCYVAVGSAASALVEFWRSRTGGQDTIEALVSGRRNRQSEIKPRRRQRKGRVS